MTQDQLKIKLRKVRNSIRKLHRKLLKKLIIEKQLKDLLDETPEKVKQETSKN